MVGDESPLQRHSSWETAIERSTETARQRQRQELLGSSSWTDLEDDAVKACFEIGVRLDFHYFHADDGLAYVRCASTDPERCALRGSAFNARGRLSIKVSRASEAGGAFKGW